MLNNPFIAVVIGDLNAKLKNWYPLDRSTCEGNIIETITSHFDLHKLIYDPTHILRNSLPYIDLILLLNQIWLKFMCPFFPSR